MISIVYRYLTFNIYIMVRDTAFLYILHDLEG